MNIEIHNKLIDICSYIIEGKYPSPDFMYKAHPDLGDMTLVIIWFICFVWLLPFRVIYEMIK